MTHIFNVTKTFEKLPVAHCQFQDTNADGTPGQCAALHGYDRSVTIEISAWNLDPYGWVFPFGAFKDIRKWLEFYFDHTSVFPANDPRLPAIEQAIQSGIIATAKILPYGVSMEMSALFLYEQANAYVYEKSGYRAAITSIEFREHSSNSGTLKVDLQTSIDNAKRNLELGNPQLVTQDVWDFESPVAAVKRIIHGI